MYIYSLFVQYISATVTDKLTEDKKKTSGEHSHGTNQLACT